MGLFSIFSAPPSPLGWGDVADDRLPTLGDVDMLNRHLLLAATSVSLERFDLSGERPGQLVEGIRGAILCLRPRWWRCLRLGTLTSPAAPKLVEARAQVNFDDLFGGVDFFELTVVG
jgi:hypothetical protein